MTASLLSRRRVHRLLGGLAAGWVLGAGPVRAAADGQRPFRILHVMSYHSPWRWTDGQLQGFQEAMRGVPAEYRVFQMDAKHQSAEAQREAKGREARALIRDWQPDLLYTSDDEAQQHVARHYVGSRLPIVFSGVNRDPRTYGFEASPNVTGVLEQEHFVESVRLLQAMVPGVRRLAAVFDDAPIWTPVQQRMRERLAQLPGLEFTAMDTIATFDEYKQKMLAYPHRADAVALVGIFNFRDAQGRNVPSPEVLRWTAEHSRLPDFSYWRDRVHHGTLASVTVSEHEQGLAAGRLARAILVEDLSPASLPMRPTLRGNPMISLARAQQLGIRVKSGLLLSSEVISRFEWTR